MADGTVDTARTLRDNAEQVMRSARPAGHLTQSALPAIEADPASCRRGTHIPRELIGFAARWTDGLVLTLIAWAAIELSGTGLLAAPTGHVLPFVTLVAGTLVALPVSGAYRLIFSRRAGDHLIRVGIASAIGLGAMLAFIWLLPALEVSEPQFRAAVAGWVSLMALHGAYLALIRILSGTGQLNENVVIVGATPNARQLIARNAESRELNIAGVFDDRLNRVPQDISGVPVLGRVDDLIGWERLPEIDRIIVTVTSNARERVRELVERLRILPQQMVLLLDLDGFDPETENLARIANSPAAYLSGAPVDIVRNLVKRGADIILASALLAFFSPVFLVTAIAIRLEDGGPVFFRQDRHGFNNQVIRVWKFRSMRPDREAEKRMSVQAFSGDPRITRVGRLIRRTSIDELPQLINVLRGDMSMVGPRPHAIGMTAQQTEVHAIVSDYAHRYRVKPGITGWAQINGSRGPVHTKQDVRERVRLDLEYLNRHSFWFDLWIMLMTAPCLLGDRMRER
jgi:Undecaprenyl-phosphate glucose phosphotransferase